MKIALLTDTHFGYRNESEIYLKANIEFLNYFFKYLKDNDIKKLYHLGDMFDDRKKISSKLLNWVKENFINRLIKDNIECVFVVGNHDTYFKKDNTPNIITELFSDVKHDNITIVDNELYQDGDVVFIPWLNTSNYEELLKQLNKKKRKVVCGHFELTGFVYQGKQVSDRGLNRELFKKHDMILSGHFHAKSNENNIHYLGNPFAINWGEIDNDHGFHLLDTDDFSLEFIKSNINLFKKIKLSDELTYKNDGEKFISIDCTDSNDKSLNILKSQIEKFDIQELRVYNDQRVIKKKEGVKYDRANNTTLELILKYINDSELTDKEDLVKRVNDLDLIVKDNSNASV